MPEPAQRVPFPPVVYVPCARPTTDDDQLEVDLWRTVDGRLALPVYSALDRLVDHCGEQQPWVVLPTGNLEAIRVATGFEVILLDVEIPEEHRRHAAPAAGR